MIWLNLAGKKWEDTIHGRGEGKAGSIDVI